MPENLDNLKQDLLHKHWLHAYNWAGISIRKLSQRYDCSISHEVIDPAGNSKIAIV